MWAPGRIPAGTECSDLIGTIDLLPTIAAITGTPLPAGKKIDGLDASAAILGKGTSPRDEFVYYSSRGNLEGIRQGKWKLLMQSGRGKPKKGKGGNPQINLFDLEADMGEKNNLASTNPEVVRKLRDRMQELDEEITKNARAPWMKEK
jgi:arylsulfatase A-like enzyme